MRKYHNPPTRCLYRSLGHGATEGVVQRGHRTETPNGVKWERRVSSGGVGERWPVHHPNEGWVVENVGLLGIRGPSKDNAGIGQIGWSVSRGKKQNRA